MVPSDGAYTPTWLCHWLPAEHLTFVWSAAFNTNMAKKEASMSRHPGWKDYVARCGFLLPSPSALLFGGGKDD